jgi:hypothetical protein
MLDLISHPAEHVVAMKAGGIVTARELQRAIDAIEAAKRTIPRSAWWSRSTTCAG